MTSVHLKRRTALGGVLALALVTGGCGAGGEEATRAAADVIAVDQAARDRLPEAVRDRGVIRFTTDPGYAPTESFAADGRTVIGFDADLAAARDPCWASRSRWCLRISRQPSTPLPGARSTVRSPP